MNKKNGVKKDWPVVSVRVPPDLRQWLEQKHCEDGEMSKLLLTLLVKYREGKIFVNLATVR